MRSLGIVFLLMAGMSVLPAMMLLRGGSGASGRLMIAMAFYSMLYLVPGLLYLFCSIYLPRRRPWAIIVGLALASVQLLFCLPAMILALGVWLKTDEPIASILAAIMLLVVAALAQLIYHLAKSFQAIRYPPIEEVPGFEPLMVEPIDAEQPGPGKPLSDQVNRSSSSS
ncbi:hypothetical protein [Fontivita pretiosa]|uniref:hypothetical protein n=1 Tax=Fontivita pretiosa TaxID=2989684 RepID=UPI003D17BF3C